MFLRLEKFEGWWGKSDHGVVFSAKKYSGYYIWHVWFRHLFFLCGGVIKVNLWRWHRHEADSEIIVYITAASEKKNVVLCFRLTVGEKDVARIASLLLNPGWSLSWVRSRMPSWCVRHHRNGVTYTNFFLLLLTHVFFLVLIMLCWVWKMEEGINRRKRGKPACSWGVRIYLLLRVV